MARLIFPKFQSLSGPSFVFQTCVFLIVFLLLLVLLGGSRGRVCGGLGGCVRRGRRGRRGGRTHRRQEFVFVSVGSPRGIVGYWRLMNLIG